jgi:hypothetical protein
MKKNTKKPIVLYEDESREVIIYRDGDNAPKVEVLLQQENLWLTQKAIATLFGVNIPAISKHIKNIVETGELDEISVVSKMEITAADNKNYQTNFYNLEMVIAVGYRVNSERAVMFRNWATKILKEYMQKGAVLDVERGLTSWKNAPSGRIRKNDVSIAKNYLNEEEILNLNEIVTMYLDYAERQARLRQVMYMEDNEND